MWRLCVVVRDILCCLFGVCVCGMSCVCWRCVLRVVTCGVRMCCGVRSMHVVYMFDVRVCCVCIVCLCIMCSMRVACIYAMYVLVLYGVCAVCACLCTVCVSGLHVLCVYAM